MFNNLLLRIKTAYRIAFKTDGMFVKSCGVCQGVHFDCTKKNIQGETYKAEFICRKCGATGKVYESWKRDDDK